MEYIIKINQASLLVFAVLLAAYIISITVICSISTPAGKQTCERGAVTSLAKLFTIVIGFTGCAILADVFATDGKTPENIIALVLNIAATSSSVVLIKYICKYCIFNLFENAKRMQTEERDEAYKIAILQRFDDYMLASEKEKAIQKTEKEKK